VNQVVWNPICHRFDVLSVNVSQTSHQIWLLDPR
jgi:hypothetical protein